MFPHAFGHDDFPGTAQQGALARVVGCTAQRSLHQGDRFICRTIVFLSLLHGTASGVQTFVSQADGAGRQRECGAWAWHGIYSVIPVALLFVAVLAPAVPHLIAWLGPSAELQGAATTYILARMPGEVCVSFSMALI